MTKQSAPASTAALKLPDTRLLVGGAWRTGQRKARVDDKFSGDQIAAVDVASADDVHAAVGLARRAFLKGAPPPYDRARILRRMADLVAGRKAQFTGLLVQEAGFTVLDAEGEVDRTVITFGLCAEEATRIVGETVAFASSPGQHERVGMTLRFPLGIVCAITPFNSPMNMIAHKAGPALAAGNAVILKPSGLTPLSAALLCELFLESGLPPDLLSMIHGPGEEVGNWLLAEQDIDFYTFTGSTDVGQKIQAGAGLRRTQLELGSIASTIVCADADLDRAVSKTTGAAFRKAGQVCTSVQRLYVERSIEAEFAERLVSAAAKMPAGDPSKAETRIGPMITENAAQRAHGWIEEARLAQARVLCGGNRARSVLDATILSNVRGGLKVHDQEIFAPVLVLIPFERLDEAVAGTNSTPYGLSAGIFTRDIGKALSAAKSMRFGAIHINEASSARADAMPFGGVKASGHGHEGPRYAIREFTEERLVTFNT